MVSPACSVTTARFWSGRLPRPSRVRFTLLPQWEHRTNDLTFEGKLEGDVLRGETCAELGEAVRERLAAYAHVTGGLALSDDWADNLAASVARFNELAATGQDADFGRGERAVQQLFNGDVREEPGRANPTMWPLSDTGPYYAALVTGGTLDTKGGPKATPDGQVVDDLDRPIPGLYGVGNCVASP